MCRGETDVPLVDEVHEVVGADLRKSAPNHGWRQSQPASMSLTDCMLVIPSTKQIASRIFDLPDPFRPVMALKDSSKPVGVSGVHSRYPSLSYSPEIVVRTGYDLNPSRMSSSILIVARGYRWCRCRLIDVVVAKRIPFAFVRACFGLGGGVLFCLAPLVNKPGAS